MKLIFDEHHLLTIEHDEIPKLKKYHFTINGYQISSFDKGLLVYHKRQRKTIHLKQLGEGMQVAYLQRNLELKRDFDVSMLEKTLALFQGFDETTGEKYHFLPFFSKDLGSLNKRLKADFDIECKITKEAQGTFIRGLTLPFSFPETIEEQLSFLFSLIELYGKIEEKKGEVLSAKIHLPLFGSWNQLEEAFGSLIENLQQQGYFINAQKLESKNRTTFQISITDGEILELFVTWLQNYENDDTKVRSAKGIKEKQGAIKQQLIEYIDSDPELALAGKEEVLKLIKTHYIKFIKYT